MTARTPSGGIAPMPSHPIIAMERAFHSVGGGAIDLLGTTVASSGASPFTANDMLAFPFVVWATTQIYKGWVLNGTSAGGNFSIGIYDADYNRVAQSASTGGSGNLAPQMVTLSAKLSAGLYYVAMAADNATSDRYSRWSVATIGAIHWKMMGCWRHASITVGSLPDPATPVVCSNVAFPYFGLITRSAFDM